MAELGEYLLHSGDRAPDFQLPGVDGKTYRLSDFDSYPLLAVVFWCNHCPYVQAWEGRTIDLGRRYGPRGVGFVLINSNDARAYPEDRLDAMVVRARDKGYPFPYLVDESQATARAYGALVTPHPMLFGPDRKLLFQGKIDNNHQYRDRVTEKYLERAIEQALGQTPVSPAELTVAGCTVKWKA
ncbi:MAG: thioredoxin family protein [Thermoplasmata archaeon]|nr:thioredoxin family protein [Thermoplasmata archaeon]